MSAKATKRRVKCATCGTQIRWSSRWKGSPSCATCFGREYYNEFREMMDEMGRVE